MAARKVLDGFAVLALGAAIVAPAATASSPCGHRACSEEIAASGLSGQARAACVKQVIADCRAGRCSCTGGSPPCSCVQCCGSPIGAFVGECVVETTCDANHPQNFGPGSCSPNPSPTCPCFGGFALCSFACTNGQEVNGCVSVLGPCDQFCLEGCRFACSSDGADCATASCGPLCP